MVAFQGYHDCALVYGRISYSVAVLRIGSPIVYRILPYFARISYSAAVIRTCSPIVYRKQFVQMLCFVWHALLVVHGLPLAFILYSSFLCLV